MKTQNVKGFKDFIGEEARKKSEIKKVLSEIFEKYGFAPAETPLVEYEEFVKGQNQNDEAISDIFKLKDKGKRNLALRYEFTFQLKRIAKNQKLPYKRYQIGEVFRDEPIKENRFRQFTQCDVDIVGSPNIIKDEAEILALTYEALNKLGIKPIILVNNRALLNEILEDKGIKKNKEQVLRELDKLDKLPKKQIEANLKKLGASKIIGILSQNVPFFKKYKSFSEINKLIDYCMYYGIKESEIQFSPLLVRGLSYYNGNIFEIRAEDMIKETIVAGGSYKLGDLQGTGISFGLERVSKLAKLKYEEEKILVVSLDKDKESISLAEKLRKKGKNVSLFYGKPSKALEYANSYNFTKAIFVGEKEVKSKKFKVKNLKTGKEEVLK